MADAPIGNGDRTQPHVEKGFDKRIIYVLIAATVLFVLAFFIITSFLSPGNSRGEGSTTNTQNSENRR